MRLPLLIVLLTLMSPCDRLWAQTDRLVGDWRFVPEQSRFRGNATDIELRFVIENGQLREDLKNILPNGKSRVFVFIHQLDGQERPYKLTGETKHRKHTVIGRRIDDYTIERRVSHDDGTEYTIERLVISPDGTKLTRTQLTESSDGTSSEDNVMVFVRR